MKHFLSLGECMLELAPAGSALYRMGYAGDTFNCAWYARRLLDTEWTVQFASVVGTDSASEGMLTFMQYQGIDTSTVRRVADRTVGLYMIQLQEGERSFSYWRNEAAARLVADDIAWLDATLSGRQVIHFSGISLAILSTEKRKILCDAITRARAGGALVAFDTNLRPKLWESEAAMRDGLCLGASVSDVVLPSFDEEEVCFGDASQTDTIARYADLGARVVVVKNGSADCHVWSKDDGVTIVPPPKVDKVIDSTAAGDSFAGGFLSAIATGSSPAEAAQKASALAARVIQKPGALAPDLFADKSPA